MNNNTSQQAPLGHYQAFIYFLLIVNFILLAFTLPEFISEIPNSYLNQHARLVSGNVGQIFLLLAVLFYRRSKIRDEIKGINRNLYLLFMVLCLSAIGIQFLLGI